MLLQRAIRAALLDMRVYENLDEGPESMFHALGIVAAAAVAFGMGIRTAVPEDYEGPVALLVILSISAILVSWVLWSTVVWWLGTRVLGGSGSHRMHLRAVGIAYGPGILMVLVAVPAIYFIATFWLLATVTVAVRGLHGFSTMKALFPSLLGWFLALWFFVPSIIFFA